MAKKLIPATTDYVNHAVAQAVNPLEERVAKLEETSYPDSVTTSSEVVTETMTPSCVYQKHEVSIDMDDNPEGIMSDEEYLFQVYPDLPRWLTKTPEQHLKMVTNLYRDKAIGQLCVEEVSRVMSNYLPSIRPKLLEFLEEERQQLADFRTDDNHDFCVKHNAMLERLKDLEARDKAFDTHIEKLNAERQAFRTDYRRALDIDSLAPRHTGLFIRGHNILPSWLLALIFVAIFLMAVISSYFILYQQEQIGHQKSQIELLQRESKHQPPFNHPQRGAKNEHPFRKG